MVGCSFARISPARRREEEEKVKETVNERFEEKQKVAGRV